MGLNSISYPLQLNTWSGSIEIGVTVCNPDVIDIPITATDLRGGTWVRKFSYIYRYNLPLSHLCHLKISSVMIKPPLLPLLAGN